MILLRLLNFEVGLKFTEKILVGHPHLCFNRAFNSSVVADMNGR